MKKSILFLLAAALSHPYPMIAQQDFSNPIFNQLEAGSVKGAFCMPGHEIWGGSVIRHDDGKYYMFASAWPANAGHWIWATNSQIVIAVSETPEGPYEYLKPAIPFRDRQFWDGGSTFNPAIRRHQGTYYLFYTGTTYNFERPEISETMSNRRDKRFHIAWNNKRIGVATSEHPQGPWNRRDHPVIEPRKGHWDEVLTSNAAPVIHEDGSVTLFYKSSNIPHENRPPKKLIDNVPRFCIGVSRADHVFGTYQRLGQDDGMISIESQHVALEDPFAWYDGEIYHMVVKNFDQEFSNEQGAALYIRSVDGVNWKLPSDEPRAYTRTVAWKEGFTMEVHRLEKPHILMEQGKPAWLFAAAYLSRKKEDYCACESCVYNVVFRIK